MIVSGFIFHKNIYIIENKFWCVTQCKMLYAFFFENMVPQSAKGLVRVFQTIKRETGHAIGKLF